MNRSNEVQRRLGVILSLVYTLVGIAAGFLFTPVCTARLGQSEYGVYTLAFSMVSYLGVFDLGFGSALIRYSARLRAQGEDPRNLYGLFLRVYLIIGAVVLALGLFICANLSRFYSAKMTAAEIELLGSMFLLLLINTALSFPANVFSSVIQANEEFIFYRLVNIANSLLTPVVSTLFLFLGHGALRLIQINVLFSVTMYAANVLFCFKKLHIRFGFAPFPREFYKELFSFSFFLFVDLLVAQIYDGTDQIILGRVCGSAAVAVYGVGVKFELYYQYLSASIANIYLPHISALATQEGGRAEMGRIFARVGRFQFLMLSFVLCGFGVFGQEFMNLWVGPDYRNAYWIALLIMVPTLFIQAQTIGRAILQALNMHRVRSGMGAVVAVFNIVISIPLAIRFEGVGAALGTCIGYCLGELLFMNWFYYKKIGLDIPGCWKQFGSILLRYAPIAAVFVLVDRLLPGDSWLQLIGKILLAVVLVLPYYCRFVLNREERALVRGFLEKRIHRSHGR